MIEPKALQTIKEQLFSVPSSTVFAILDGASVPDLLVNLATFDPEHVCLYRGELEPDLAEVAPYLAILGNNSPFTDWVLANGWGEHWSIFGVAKAELQELRKHFRKFLMVYDESGKSLYFRYYDPRVLRLYLPTCNVKELQTVFGPVSSYLLEDEDPKAARTFTCFNGVLRDEKFSLDDSAR